MINGKEGRAYNNRWMNGGRDRKHMEGVAHWRGGLRTLESCGTEREDEAQAKRKLFAAATRGHTVFLLRWFPLVSSVSVFALI